MRKITKESVSAYVEGRSFNKDNTDVIIHDKQAREFVLFGNTISGYNPVKRILTITNCGWETNTTKERLNGILQGFGLSMGIVQRNHKWIIQYYQYSPEFKVVKEILWDGKPFEIKFVI